MLVNRQTKNQTQSNKTKTLRQNFILDGRGIKKLTKNIRYRFVCACGFLNYSLDDQTTIEMIRGGKEPGCR